MVGFRPAVPFPAIVGRDRLKRALLAVAVNDALDGLLVRGEKGTAKSTAVRALVDLLPDQRAIADCPYGCPPDDPAAQCDSCRGRDDPPVETRPVPLVTVPLGATRERIVGSLSLPAALDGAATFEPGLLARANRGILYVDEVNLLDDHLVDVLLDAAASGRNRVERDGVSESHPASFTLIGTMNPEEGDLRPQLRDRFALQVEVAGSRAIDERVAIVESAIERDGEGAGDPEPGQLDSLRETIVDARDALGDVMLPEEHVETIAEVCLAAGVDGHRGDIAAARTARTFAALDGRTRVTAADIEDALGYALPHRLRSRPFEETPPLADVLDEHFEDDDPPDHPGDEPPDRSGTDGLDGDATDRQEEREPGDGEDDRGERDGRDGRDGRGDSSGGGRTDRDSRNRGRERPEHGTGASRDGDAETVEDSPERVDGSGGTHDGGSPQDADGTPAEPDADHGAGSGPDDDPDGSTGQADRSDDERTVHPPASSGAVAPVGPGTAPDIPVEGDATASESTGGSGRVGSEPSADAAGPRIRTEPAESSERIDVPATIREGARRGRADPDRRDLRQSVRAGTASALVVFAVDASASMRPAMRTAKGTALDLLKESYRERDEVALVTFAGEGATVLLPPTDSVSLAARHLKELPTGDRTPLPAGLQTAGEVIDRADPAASVAVVVTDGRTNVADQRPTAATREAARALGDRADEVLVVDASSPDDRATLIEDMVAAADGRSIPLSELSGESVRSVSQSARQ